MPSLINGRQVMGAFEDSIEYAGEAIGDLFKEVTGSDVKPQTNEGPAKGHSAQEQQTAKHEAGMPAKGEIIFNQKSEIRAAEIASEMMSAYNETASKPTVDDQRERINTLNNLQADYTGSVDAQGNVTTYHAANAEKAEAEKNNSAYQIQQGKGEKMDKAGGEGFEMKENELGLGGENKNHFTANVG